MIFYVVLRNMFIMLRLIDADYIFVICTKCDSSQIIMLLNCKMNQWPNYELVRLNIASIVCAEWYILVKDVTFLTREYQLLHREIPSVASHMICVPLNVYNTWHWRNINSVRVWFLWFENNGAVREVSSML